MDVRRRPFTQLTLPLALPVPHAAVAAAAAAAAAIVLLLAGCGGAGSGAAGSSRLQVVAAESFWGSIAAQLGGSRASVQSIIVNPAQDPHSYEPLPGDARALASAQLAIVNGIGYDAWAQKLLAANPASGRLELNVGQLLGLTTGHNPHRWYDPADVEAVANAITRRLQALDPSASAYFTQQRAAFQRSGLGPYHALINRIRAGYAGVPVGASESIFALLAPALGLRLITPASFMKAITEGTDVSAQDTITTQQQITSHQIRVWVYNVQNATPQVQRLTALARTQGIGVVSITETLSPASLTFQQWQAAELSRLSSALRKATGR